MRRDQNDENGRGWKKEDAFSESFGTRVGFEDAGL